MTFKLHVLIVTVLYVYYIVLFNIGNLKGHIFTTGILFGLSEVLGILIGEPIVKMLPDWLGFQISMSLAFLTWCLLQMGELNQVLTYALFLI